jgi:hypothetical protein
MMDNGQRYHEALRQIAKEYLTTEQLAKRAEKLYGVNYHEALEMSYDNIQATAANAIRGRHRPWAQEALESQKSDTSLIRANEGRREDVEK